MHWKGIARDIFECEEMSLMLEEFCKEIKVISKLKHNNVVSFWGIYYKQLPSVAVAVSVLVMEKLDCS